MISICIPVYNVDVRKLTRSLKEQAGSISAEIILIDDGSLEKYRDINRTLEDELVKYHELEENIGRARIRNRFTKHAQNTHLLFLDCDTTVISEDFIKNYSQSINGFPEDIICGGSIYQAEKPERARRLHWKYGMQKESQPARIRNLSPTHSFMTANFLVPGHILKEIPFDERLSGYGHEDSLFGYDLSRRGKKIIHIDNPVTHEGIELNKEFIRKTAEAVQSLVIITELLQDDPGFIDSITLLKTAKRLKSAGLAGLILALSYISTPLFKYLLEQGFASLNLLNAFKLGLYLRLKKQSSLS